jgi:hypothetical protein
MMGVQGFQGLFYSSFPAISLFSGVQLEVGLNKSSAESAEQQSPGRKPWDQA